MGESVLGNNLAVIGDCVMDSDTSWEEDQAWDLQGPGAWKWYGVAILNVVGHKFGQYMGFLGGRLVVSTGKGLLEVAQAVGFRKGEIVGVHPSQKGATGSGAKGVASKNLCEQVHRFKFGSQTTRGATMGPQEAGKIHPAILEEGKNFLGGRFASLEVDSGFASRGLLP